MVGRRTPQSPTTRENAVNPTTGGVPSEPGPSGSDLSGSQLRTWGRTFGRCLGMYRTVFRWNPLLRPGIRNIWVVPAVNRLKFAGPADDLDRHGATLTYPGTGIVAGGPR